MVCIPNLIKFVFQTCFINQTLIIMETNKPDSDLMDEKQSLEVIREMIRVSRIKMQNNGLLFIVWGWAMFVTNLTGYLKSTLVTTFAIGKILDYIGVALGLLAIVFTLYYILKQRRKAQSYISISLRYVWISMIVCMSLTSMILANNLRKPDFDLQHPVFMVFIAFATVVTGGILRYRLIIAGGIVFGILAYICSYMNLQNQILMEAIAWLATFIIPGHILFANRKK